ncbi:hypothetical protein BY458DRAFT_530091 [Sporodiniella umbellata]|nr:hypothetical protein BY458DRAFT_530091 [Sporodiniella umbellata]
MLLKEFPSHHGPSGSISITTRTGPILKTKSQNRPGLSFFCQPIVSLSKQTKTTELQPMVVSRINLPITKPIEDTKREAPQLSASPPTRPLGIGTFMLRGYTQKRVVNETKAHQRIENLEVEKSSLLILNQTLEIVVKEQSHTILDLKKRLAAIERPLTPDLDTTTSENGIMSCHPLDLADDLAFERLRLGLISLIQQAQSAVYTLPPPARPSRVKRLKN